MAPLKLKIRNARASVIGACIALVWVVLDQWSKAAVVAHATNVGGFDTIEWPLLNLFQFNYVQNKGAAWGMFSGSTVPLGIFSLVVCILLFVYLLFFAEKPNTWQVIGLGLVIGGGIGNVIDRFFVGYVVDFIEFGFFDFPVFNVADIGVTCGFVIFVIGLIIAFRNEDKALRAQKDASL